MEEVQQYLRQKAAKAERWAEHMERKVYEAQKQIAVDRAEIGQYRAMADEFRRLASTYDRQGTVKAQEGAATAFSEGGQGVDTTSDEKGVGGREISHVHVDEEPVGSALPESVWVDYCDIEAGQLQLASDRSDERVLLQVSMLTPEQKAKYCKPTSNADDFGGMPG